jgi:hypothetical protein
MAAARPALAHTTLLANDGTPASSGYVDTSISPWWRQASKAGRERPVHAEMAHVAERHRRAGWVRCAIPSTSVAIRIATVAMRVMVHHVYHVYETSPQI